MERRDFLKAGAAAGLGLALGLGAPNVVGRGKRRASAFAAEPARADMVAVRNGEPGVMFDQGIAAMGGMGRFVKPGQTVAVKPNVSWESRPEFGGNTHPELVSRIIRHCLDAGAAKVIVFDHNIENGRRCYEASGIAAAAADAGAEIAPAEAERHYQSMDVDGRSLKNVAVHEAALGADVFINVPVLKHHGGAGMTAAIKGLMGAVWNRRYYHGNNLHQCLADFLAVRKPDLNVVDCYRVMTSHGPRGGSPEDVRLVKMQLLSTDIVAVDAAAARLMGREPGDCRYVTLAHEAGHGEIDAARLATRRITV